jgi:hypothetical protein
MYSPEAFGSNSRCTVDAMVAASDVGDGPVDVARADVARANLDDGISDQGFIGNLPDAKIDVMRSPIDPVHDHVSAVVQLVRNPSATSRPITRGAGLPVENHMVSGVALQILWTALRSGPFSTLAASTAANLEMAKW